ncbi:MAG TPA: oligosaccharide flippase family protein [Abditibacteriaceae bacterium]|nr:oligosaccharide flippase family protein [Abditibacteriaceae bacterium]
MRNFLSLAGAETLSKLVTFGAFAYLARVAGPIGFGYVEFAGAVVMCASLVVDQGFSPFGAREIAKAPERTGALVAEIVTARFILALGAYLAVVLLAFWLDRSPMVTWLLLIYGVSLLAAPLLLQWVFQGHDRMQVVAAAQMIRQTIFAAVVFAFVRGPAQLLFVAIAEVAGVSSAAAYCVWMYRRHFKAGGRARPVITKHLFSEGAPIGLSQMFWVVRMFGATLILGMVAAAEDVGFFAGAQRILVALHTFVWLYYFNLLPSLARAWQKGDGSFARLIARSLHGVAWISAAGGIMWVLTATEIMGGVYGPMFAPAGSTLQWLAGVCVAAFISGHYRFGLIAAGRQTAEMWTSTLGAAVAIVLMPIGYARGGTSGAAMGLFASEVVVWSSAWWCGRRMLGLRGHARLLIRPLVAAAIVAGMLWALPLAIQSVRSVLAVMLLTGLALALDAAVRKRLRQFSVVSQQWVRQREGRGAR